MSEPRDQAGVPPSDGVLDLDGIQERFATAWATALTGGPEPVLEAFIRMAGPAQRLALRARLEPIDRSFREARTGGANSETLAVTVAPGRAGSGLDDTLAATLDGLSAATLDGEADFALATTMAEIGGPGEAGTERLRVAGYEITGELGRGGMGVVYAAIQKRLQRRVALKMLLAGVHAGEEQLSRFQMEAESVAQLLHPNIVQIYEVSEQDGIPFFSLEFVDGGGLDRLVAEKPFVDRDAAQMILTLARAMHFAHGRGILHRDLKPANILLTRDGTPKISDFGLAKRLEGDSSQTRSGTLMGTPSYMAPEQARGDTHNLGPAVDIYALGAILYELLTGRPPFRAAKVLDTLEQVRSQEPVPPSQLQPTVSRDLETICLKCLEKDPERRYETADTLGDDLKRFLDGEPILARPITSRERLWRWCRRNPRVALLTATVALLLATIATTSSIGVWVIERKRREAEGARLEATRAQLVAEQKTAEAVAARAQAEAARKQADRNAEVASTQSKLAIDSLYGVVTRVQNQLKGQPGLRQLREDLLKDAMTGLDRVSKASENAPLVLRTRAGAIQRMGDIALELGQTEEALTRYQQGREIIEGLAEADPDDDAVLWNLAVFHDKIGDVQLQLLGDAAIARTSYDAALKRRLTLASRPIKVPELKPEMLRNSLANNYSKNGSLALYLGDPKAAWEAYRQYLERAAGHRYENPADAAAVATDPEGPLKALPVSVLIRLGEVAFRLGDAASATAFEDQALARSRALPMPRGLRDVAAALAATGDRELMTGNASEALARYRESDAALKEYDQADPGGVNTRRDLALAAYRLATAYQVLGQTDESDAAYRTSLTAREALAQDDPRNAHKQIDLMLSLARCGERARAIETAERLRTLVKDDPTVLFFVACAYAVCADDAEPTSETRPKDLAAALDALERSVAVGYRDAVALRTDPDLAAVRDDPRFQALLDRLEPR